MHVVDAPHLRLLRLLRDEGPISRAELGDRLDLTRPRLLAEVERLVAAGLHRRGRHGRLPGRPPLHAGRAAPAAAVRRRRPGCQLDRHRGDQRPARAGGAVPGERRHPLRPEGRSCTGSTSCSPRPAPTGRSSGSTRVGIGVPGPVSFRDGVPVSPPIMPGWDRYPVRELLAREHGCPAVVDNDVNIMAIGERHGGVAHSVDDFLFVKIGTGIGCGIHLGGDVYRGVDGCAGDIGHIQVDSHGPMCSCGNAGCLEALFSGAALARDALAAARSGDVAGAGRAPRRQRRDRRPRRRRRRRGGRRHLHPAHPRRRPPGRRRCWPRWSASPTRR